MTLEQFLEYAGQKNTILLGVFIGLPCLTLLLRFIHGKHRGNEAPWKYVYSVFIYLTCIPGMFAVVLTGYTLFFLHENLMRVNMLPYFLPILSMVTTLAAIKKTVDFDEIPGFNRILGLMILLGASFLIAFTFDRLRLWIVFRGSMVSLLILSVLLFVLLKWGMHKLFGKT